MRPLTPFGNSDCSPSPDLTLTSWESYWTFYTRSAIMRCWNNSSRKLVRSTIQQREIRFLTS